MAQERIDDLQRNGCRIIQRPDLFCFGMDAVLLAYWAGACVRRGSRVLDLCSGNGVVPILMDARLPDALRAEGSVHFTGVEINSISVDMSRRSAAMNGQDGRIRFLEGDIRSLRREKPDARPGGQHGEMRAAGAAGQCWQTHAAKTAGQCGQTHAARLAGQCGQTHAAGPAGQRGETHAARPAGSCAEMAELSPGSFDCVTVNPPYMAGQGGLKGESRDRAIARHEVLCTIDDVAASSAAALKMGGHLCMVHRPHRLGDIFQAMERHGLAVKRLRMVHPFPDREAMMVLIDAAKGGRMYVRVERPLVIYREAGVYTEEVRALYG